jgi:hypothetical protein
MRTDVFGGSMITPEQLAAWQTACEKATDDWRLIRDEDFGHHIENLQSFQEGCIGDTYFVNEDDAEFIALARQAMPLLIEALEHERHQKEAAERIIQGAPWYQDLTLAQDEAIKLREKLAVAEEALSYISKTCHWYASVHQGPEHEVHHALKVEVHSVADEALAKLRSTE